MKTAKETLRMVSTIVILSLTLSAISAQQAYQDVNVKDSAKIYKGGDFYDVVEYIYEGIAETPKNIILLIGDGMGAAQIYAGMTANGGDIYLENFTHTGFATTFAANRFVTGSAASGTALATGHKTNYGYIGVDTAGNPLMNVRELAQHLGKSTGVVSTSSVTHATPASFVGHQMSRNMEEEIAADFLTSGIDVFIGGGLDFFTKRKDGRNLFEDLKSKDYQVATSLEELEAVKSGKLAGLLAPNGMERRSLRGDVLVKASSKAMEILDDDPDGFFLMIEGSQIDWAGHDNDMTKIVEEFLDFDLTVGKVLEFAAKDKQTLVIVTADHETGGLTIEDGNLETGYVKGDFTTGGHTGIMVPVFAFGPGAESFAGFMDNTDIPKRIMKYLKADQPAKVKNKRK